MRNSHGRQETRNSRGQQGQHPNNRNEQNRNRSDESSRFQDSDESSYSARGDSGLSDDEYDSRYRSRSRQDRTIEQPDFNRGPSNQDWTRGGSDQQSYRENRPGRYGRSIDESDFSEPGNRRDRMGADEWRYSSGTISRFNSRGQQGDFGHSEGRERTQQDYPSSSDMRPSFAGRGPQNYKRSDERITEDINEELTQDHDVDATNITVETKNGEVVLKGTVTHRQAKRRAEDIAEACSGVTDVQNQIRVKRDEMSYSGSDSKHDKSDKQDDKRSNKIAS